jgi:hypothetical protein
MAAHRVFLFFILFFIPSPLLISQGITNSYLGLATNDETFIFNMGTSSAYSPANANLLYAYDYGYATSHIVVKVNNTAYDLEDTTNCPVVSGSVQNGGTYITGAKNVAGLVKVYVLWEFVNNPATGSPADTAMIRFTLTNTSSSTVNVALRLLLDTMVINNDGTNISVNNGFTVINQNTAWYKSLGQIPQNWWDFDVNPTEGTPTLEGRGYNYNNIYEAAATEPDIMEVANWVDVSSTAQWSVAPSGKEMSSYDDSSVVLWWCNGDQNSSGFSLAPNSSITFITYYGINLQQMLTTPTATCTWTQSFTATQTPTITDTFTPTVTPTITLTATGSYTPTLTVTPTIAETASPTSSVTVTLTRTPYFTGTDSPTATQSFTITASYTTTLTPMPTFTFTVTASPTYSATKTPTFTATPSFTITTTMPPTPTATCTRIDFCFEMLGIFPNPFSTETTIVYKVCLAANVDAIIYTVSGEIVRRLHQQAVPGWNSLHWDGKNNSGRSTASGVFIYSIEAVSGDERNKFWGKVAAVK